MKNFNNTLIYGMVSLVLCLAVFVLFQYYSQVNNISQPFERNESELIKIKVYYSNTEKNPEMLDCSLVFPLERVITSREKIYEDTLQQLLVDPNQNEKAQGYKNMIPIGTKLNFVKLKQGVLHADFSRELDYVVGGSCWISAIRSQIENTMRQWSEIKDVLISIEGESEIILQP